MKVARSTETWTYSVEHGWFQRKWGQYDAIVFKDEKRKVYVWRLEIGGSGAADGRELGTGTKKSLHLAKRAAHYYMEAAQRRGVV